jgi:hypothetical protein
MSSCILQCEEKKNWAGFEVGDILSVNVFQKSNLYSSSAKMYIIDRRGNICINPPLARQKYWQIRRPPHRTHNTHALRL